MLEDLKRFGPSFLAFAFAALALFGWAQRKPAPGHIVWTPVTAPTRYGDVVDVYVRGPLSPFGQLAVRKYRLDQGLYLGLQDIETGQDYAGPDSSVYSVSVAWGDTIYWRKGWAPGERP
jgi:hypothetical protein